MELVSSNYTVLNEFVKMSSATDKLFAALAKAQGDFKEAGKDAKNPHFNSSFASLHSLREASEPALAANGLSVTQHPISYPGGIVGVVSILSHSSGQWMSSEFRIKARDESAQPMGTAVSYARRYSYASILGLAAVEDDDGNNSSSHQLPSKAYNEGYAQVVASANSDYVIDFGTHSGKRLEQLSAADIKNSISYWKEQEKIKGKPLTGKPYLFVKNAQAYLEAQVNKPFVKEDFPPFTDLDEPQF